MRCCRRSRWPGGWMRPRPWAWCSRRWPAARAVRPAAERAGVPYTTARGWLHRWAVIAEAAGDKLTARERGALARQIAARPHAHPDGSSRTYSRGTIDRWLRAWRKGGLAALTPAERADTGTVRAHPELFAEA